MSKILCYQGHPDYPEFRNSVYRDRQPMYIIETVSQCMNVNSYTFVKTLGTRFLSAEPKRTL